ncbi:MAG: metal ABC transporter ATP-binding protein [Candidatus Babeliales bacterium]
MNNIVEQYTKNSVAFSHLTVGYQNTPILLDITVTIPEGVLLALVGPNGAGKSTLIKTMVNLIQPIAGTITIFGKPHTDTLSTIAYIPQHHDIDWNFPTYVLDMILMGSYRRRGWFRGPSAEDNAKAYELMRALELESLAYTPIGHLSGGQRQRALIAQALMQNTNMYLFDEPFKAIDAYSEKITISYLKKIRDLGKTIIIVHHDLHTVASYFDWALLLNKTVVACGPVQKVFTSELLSKTYAIDNNSPLFILPTS